MTNEQTSVERPDLRTCNRAEARAYIEHLEERIAKLVSDPGNLPRARRSDPGTSHKAAFDAFPKAKTRRGECLRAIARSGSTGMTQSEVATATGIDGVWKRLSELDQGGWIWATGAERPGTKGSMQRVYVLTMKGIEAVAREAP